MSAPHTLGQFNPIEFWHAAAAPLVTICIFNFMLALTVGGITEFSRLIHVSLFVSAAGALANGCAFGANSVSLVTPSPHRILPLSITAVISWFAQEVGLCFYSYVILRRILHKKQRIVFMVGFWLMFAACVAIRITYVVLGLQRKHLNVYARTYWGYFGLIAAIELWSAFFLLRSFFRARKSSALVNRNGSSNGLLSELMRSTEVRVGLLFIIGIIRIATHWYPYEHPKNTYRILQVESLDDFAVVAENVYPAFMTVDIIFARLARMNDQKQGLQQYRAFRHPNTFNQEVELVQPPKAKTVTSKQSQSITDGEKDLSDETPPTTKSHL